MIPKDVRPCKGGVPIFVRANASGGAGTEAQPFGTLAQATAHASRQRWCEADLRVAPGTYAESVVLDRNLRMRKWAAGAKAPPATSAHEWTSKPKIVVVRGSFTNDGPFRLDLAGLRIDNAGGPAAIAVSNAAAVTRLDGVTIQSAQRRGILHDGGTLLADRVTVHDTRRVPGDLSTGVAILARGGARVRLGAVDLVESASSGLVVRDPQTVVDATDLEVRNTGSNPDATAILDELSTPTDGVTGFAAVQVDRGKVDIDNLQISRAVVGVHLGRGGRARLRAIDVAQVHGVSEGSTTWGGAGIHVAADGVLDLGDFRVHHGSFGLWMVGATGSMRDGTFADLRIGMVTGELPADFDPGPCLGHGIRFERVDTHINVTRLDVSPPNLDGPAPTYRPCPTVAAESISE